ncbi:hypothetical protein SAMD00019534_090000 [Acytostelium subglobosum LB1]|uniref:hypothetical protein n=1 Tax=Acytostelium subglobosum LB1 TaxID=1410327 RepID=UPI000644F84E|nr:hypothetical protein SAMD00019534_090000 [Acytostelium subglobosum LB1]GAM25825.1 hypothetical protein SAMD00019534_090000 [Acytostelium subglobosum LB1]|eukprot:XP_012751343.1 hypothetical protein SAMD00019534_090000 [Acytostelium subglobosum LB1]
MSDHSTRSLAQSTPSFTLQGVRLRAIEIAQWFEIDDYLYDGDYAYVHGLSDRCLEEWSKLINSPYAQTITSLTFGSYVDLLQYNEVIYPMFQIQWRHVTRFKIYDNPHSAHASFSQSLMHRGTIFEDMVACGLHQLQKFVLMLEVNDVDLLTNVHFDQKLLAYLKSTKTLKTFRYNQQMTRETLEFLLQSPESTIRNLTLVHYDWYSNDYPTISKHLHKLSIELVYVEESNERALFSDEFLKSLSNVDHLKTNMLFQCSRMVGLNKGSTSISLPFGLISDSVFDDLIEQLTNNSTISFIYNFATTNIVYHLRDYASQDQRLMRIKNVVDSHPSIINKSTWHWQLKPGRN